MSLELYIDKLATIVSGDTGKKNRRGSLELENLHWQEASGLSAGGDHKLAISQANYSVPFGDVLKAKYVLIQTAGEVHVKINGSGNSVIELKGFTDINGAAVPGMLFLIGQNVTSIHLTNPSAAVTVEATVLIVGTET